MEYDPLNFYQTVVILDEQTITHERYIYGILDLLGDLGGVTELFIAFFSFFLFPIAQHSFLMMVLRKLYSAKSSDIFLFKS